MSIIFTAMSSYLSPFMVRSENWKINSVQYFFNLWTSVAVPATVYFIKHHPNSEMGDHVIIVTVMIVNVVLGAVILVLRSHHNLFQYSKILKIFCVKPIVHKSMICDYLQRPQKYDKGKSQGHGGHTRTRRPWSAFLPSTRTARVTISHVSKEFLFT